MDSCLSFLGYFLVNLHPCNEISQNAIGTCFGIPGKVKQNKFSFLVEFEQERMSQSSEAITSSLSLLRRTMRTDCFTNEFWHETVGKAFYRKHKTLGNNFTSTGKRGSKLLYLFITERLERDASKCMLLLGSSGKGCLDYFVRVLRDCKPCV